MYPRALCCLVLLASFITACDGGPPPIPLDAARPDGGPGPVPRDAGPPRDGSTPADASSVDPPDAGTASCVVDPGDVHSIGTDAAGDRALALAAGAESFGVLYTAIPEGGVLSRVHGVALSSAGVLGAPHPLTESGAARRPVALASIGTSWIAAWVDNDPATFELRTLALAADLAPASGATARHLTDTAAIGEDAPALLADSDGALLAWIEDDMLAGTRVARAQGVGADGAPVGTAGVASTDAHRPGELGLSELSAGPVLLYTSAVDTPDGPEASLFLQGLTSAGAMRGSATAIDEEGNVDGTFDAALTPSGGAVVFGVLVGGVRREVRFRALDGDGARLGDERILAEGADASIASFAGGYAVSYRAPASGETPAEVRLLLVSDLGETIAEVPVAEVLPAGGRTTVRVSGDGQIAVAWASGGDTSTDLYVAYVACGGGA